MTFTAQAIYDAYNQTIRESRMEVQECFPVFVVPFEQAPSDMQSRFEVMAAKLNALDEQMNKKPTFADEYELALHTGNARFGSECKHEHIHNGFCLECLRRMVSR